MPGTFRERHSVQAQMAPAEMDRSKGIGNAGLHQSTAASYGAHQAGAFNNLRPCCRKTVSRADQAGSKGGRMVRA